MKKISATLLATLCLTHYCFAESTVSGTGAPVTDASTAVETNPSVSGTNTINTTPDENKSTPASSLTLDNNMEITATVKHEENAELPYTIDYSYPQITGDSLSPAATRFNELVMEKVTASLQQFKNYVKADMPHMQTLPDSLKRNSLEIDYTVDVLKAGKQTLISLCITTEGMQAGRAHPYHKHQTLNFNLTTDKELTLTELFKPRAKYLTIFSQYSESELNKKLQDKWMIKEGTAPVEKNYTLWNLKNNGIEIIFEEYQVAPYVAGSQTVVIPYSMLKNDIALNSPIAACTSATSCEDKQ